MFDRNRPILANIFLICFLFTTLFPQLGYGQVMPNNNKDRDFRGMSNSNPVNSFGQSYNTMESMQSTSQIPSMPQGGDGNFYNIHIIGEVVRSGTYKILPSDRITDAIKYAGGILPNGSQRFVRLSRDGESKTFDLFSYRYHGNLGQNPYLSEGDVIYVPIKKGEFRIEGPVGRPGAYEITGNITLKQSIQMAGGFVAGLSQVEPIRVIRFNPNEEKIILESPSYSEDLDKFVVHKGDIIIVPHLLLTKNTFDYNINRIPGDNIFYPTINSYVFVIGAVAQSGPYMFQPGLSYKDYIGLAGPLNTSNLGRSKILNAGGVKGLASNVTQINPGDTIIVPEKSFTVNNALTWFNTVTNTTLTTILLYDRMKNF